MLCSNETSKFISAVVKKPFLLLCLNEITSQLSKSSSIWDLFRVQKKSYLSVQKYKDKVNPEENIFKDINYSQFIAFLCTGSVVVYV